MSNAAAVQHICSGLVCDSVVYILVLKQELVQTSRSLRLELTLKASIPGSPSPQRF